MSEEEIPEEANGEEWVEQPTLPGPMQEAYEKAKQSDKAEPLTVKMITWEKGSPPLFGKLLSMDTLPESKFQTNVIRYVLMTDFGLASCLLGSAADKELQGKIHVGDLLRIEYRGKKDIGENRQVNIFDVQCFGHEEVKA